MARQKPVRLCLYSGESIPVLGSVDVTVTYKTQCHKVTLIVVKGSGITLMGRNWLQVFNLDWQEILFYKVVMPVLFNKSYRNTLMYFKKAYAPLQASKPRL